MSQVSSPRDLRVFSLSLKANIRGFKVQCPGLTTVGRFYLFYNSYTYIVYNAFVYWGNTHQKDRICLTWVVFAFTKPPIDLLELLGF